MAIQSTIQKLEGRYNADNDLIPGTPVVTWADYQLLDCIEALLARVESLESEVKRLKKTQNYDFALDALQD